ncbi:Mob1/phocein [Chiua virens]|nr:Mob1/phocein [Chiua virens]
MSLLQRPYRGSRVSSFYPVKSLPPLSSLDSAFQLQEYISLLIRLDVHDVDAIVSLPGKQPQNDFDEGPELDPKDPDRKGDISVDKACWIYEQLRRLAQDLSHPLITMLQQECTRSSCPQMKAGEWLYLCVAHGNDGAMEQCCAIDYILHTVDSATALLNSPRAFPSRLSIPQTSYRHFSSLARRLGRIFAHAYFHHREAFEQAEAESSLYARFLKLTNLFELVPAEFLVIPESAIHHDDKSHVEEVEPPRLFSVAVHPIPNLQNDSLSAGTTPDIDQLSNSHSRVVDSNQLGTDSPRRLGRSRTDTMVFSEGFSVAEDLSRIGDSAGLLGASPLTETQSLVSEQPWPDLQTRTDDLDDEDIGDARSETEFVAPLSPPVEAMSLISLEDLPVVAPSTTSALDDTRSDPLGQDSPPAIEEPIPVSPVPEENPPIEQPSKPEEVDVGSSEESPESTQVSPAPEQEVAEEPDAEPELPSVPEHPLELNEPPPSEPIPPESESDITDEVGGPDGDEVKEGGEEGSVGE